LLLGLLAACSNSAPPPSVTTLLDPDDAAAPVTDRPYRPIMAGTVYHGIGDRP
jgi:hypothetical protein